MKGSDGAVQGEIEPPYDYPEWEDDEAPWEDEHGGDSEED